MEIYITYITAFALTWLIGAVVALSILFIFNLIMRIFSKTWRWNEAYKAYLGVVTFISAARVFPACVSNGDWAGAAFFAAIMIALIFLYVAKFRWPKISN